MSKGRDAQNRTNVFMLIFSENYKHHKRYTKKPMNLGGIAGMNRVFGYISVFFPANRATRMLTS